MAQEQTELVEKALIQAWKLGQIYWQQADSDYPSQHRKADATESQFKTLVAETIAALAPKPQEVE